MASFTELSLFQQKNKWWEWINQPIDFNMRTTCGVYYDITIKEYIEKVVKRLMSVYNLNGIIFLVNDNKILNDAMNYYYHIWRLNRKYNVDYDRLTLFGKKQRDNGLLPTYNMIDHLNFIFNDNFWENFTSQYSKNAGIFDEIYSEFGRIFWNDLRFFLYQYINIQILKENMGSHEINMVLPEQIQKENEDPYLVDQITQSKSGIYE